MILTARLKKLKMTPHMKRIPWDMQYHHNCIAKFSGCGDEHIVKECNAGFPSKEIIYFDFIEMLYKGGRVAICQKETTQELLSLLHGANYMCAHIWYLRKTSVEETWNDGHRNSHKRKIKSDNP